MPIENLPIVLDPVRAAAGLVQQTQEESYCHQDREDHRESEEAQPEPFHPGRAPSSAALAAAIA
jgi:hypothetical protein